MRIFPKNEFLPARLGRRGFTTFDLLLAVALVAVMSALVAANYSDFRQTTNLKAESEKLTSLIRKAQLWALSGQTRGGVRPPGGWGVYIERCTTPPCRYFLYADMSPTAPPNHAYDAGSDEIVNEIFTGQRVQISNVAPLSGTALDLVFTSPTSSGYINGAQADNQALITFYHQDAYRFQSITVDRITNRVLLAEMTEPPTNPACADWLDNDLDGYIDYPQDPGCINSADNDEYDEPYVPPPMAITVFEDTFTTQGANETLTAHTPDIGAGWQPIISVLNRNESAPGTTALMASAANSALEQITCGANSGALYQTTNVMSQPNYRVQATYSNNGGANDFAAVAARIQDNGNMYLFQWDQNRGQLFVRYNSAWLQLGRDTAGVALGEEVRLTVWDNRIGVWKYDGGAILTLLINEVNDLIPESSPPGRAGVGLGSIAANDVACFPQRLDNFRVMENVTAPPPQCNDGLDNDHDGTTDVLDSGCVSSGDDLEYAALPQVVPVFYDDFNALNANTVLDSPAYYTNVGPLFGSGWTQLVGGTGSNMQASVASDWLEDGTCASDEGSLYRINDTLLLADYEVTANYRGADNSDDYSVLAARIQDPYNMYAFQWSTTQGQLWVANSGAWTQLGTSVTGLAERDDITLKVQGSTISVLRNGLPILSVNNTSHTAPGYAGVGEGAVITSGADCSGQELDNFKVLIPN